MGAKTALLAFAEGDIRPALLGATRSERSEAEDLVRHVWLLDLLSDSLDHDPKLECWTARQSFRGICWSSALAGGS